MKRSFVHVLALVLPVSAAAVGLIVDVVAKLNRNAWITKGKVNSVVEKGICGSVFRIFRDIPQLRCGD